MQNKTILLLFSVAVVSCGTGSDSRYKDTTMLERPPNLQIRHQAEEQIVDEGDANAKPGVITGLGDTVSMTDANPPAIWLKLTFNEAWMTIVRALNQLELKITDRNQEEKVFYVKFDADDYQPDDAGILSTIASPFKNDFAEETYILRVEPKRSETVITAELADKAEQNGGEDIKEIESHALTDGSSNLLKALYKTLRDDLKPE